MANNTTTLKLFGRRGAVAAAEASESCWTLLDVKPDALVDGRPAWLPETAARVKVEREARRTERRRG